MENQEPKKPIRQRLEELQRQRLEREQRTNAILNQILSVEVTPPESSREIASVENTEEFKAAHVPQPKKKKQELKIQHLDADIAVAPKAKVETYNQEIQVGLGDSSIYLINNQAGYETAGTNEREAQQEEEMMELPHGSSAERVESQISEDHRPAEVASHDPNAKIEISPEEVKNILKSKDFVDFFERSSKLIEKALDSKNVDLFEDILMNDTSGQYEDAASRKELQELQTFFDQQLSSNRIVTSIDWSPNLPELFLTSYSQSFEGNPNEPQGVLLLWSLSLRARPEFTCYCQSQVTVAKFNQYSNSTIVGGTYSGQIVIWDLRTKSTPVQRSGMATGGHAHPVYSLAIVGTQNSHNIVSLSNDGKLCVWNTSMLAAPQKEIDLKFKGPGEQTHLDIINATCMAFPHEEANNFYTGVEDGTIYSAQVHGNQTNDNVIDAFVGHQAPITSLSVMPYFQDLSSDVSNLLLSSSYDWTVKLWNPKTRAEYLWSFEAAEDYIYDVAWNPSNPTLFSSVDGEGYIDLWDLSKDLEVPYLHHKGDTRALNKVSWSKDGSKLLTGSSNGYLKLYGLHKNLTKASEESMDRFETQIYNMIKKDKKE